MSDPRAMRQQQALDPVQPVSADAEVGGHFDLWARRLVVFLRAMAGLSMIKGLYHWAVVCGINAPTPGGFADYPTPYQSATVFFAVIDLVAAVGLWLAAAWGGVVWLTATISMAAIELGFPQVFGGRLWIAIPEFGTLIVYIALALMAGRERPH